MKRFLVWILFTLACPAALAAWPEKPITIIVAYPPGGGTDVVARAIAPFLEKYLGGGARFLVVNRSGRRLHHRLRQHPAAHDHPDRAPGELRQPAALRAARQHHRRPVQLLGAR